MIIRCDGDNVVCEKENKPKNKTRLSGHNAFSHLHISSQIARFMGPTRGPPGSCRPQMGPMLVPWTLLSGINYKVVMETTFRELPIQYLKSCLSQSSFYTQPCPTDEMHLKIMTTILLRPQYHLFQICSSPSFMHLISKKRRNFIHICPYRIRYYCKNVTKSFTFMNICIVVWTSPYLLVNSMRSAFDVHQCFVFTQAVSCSRVLPVQFYHRR